MNEQQYYLWTDVGVYLSIFATIGSLFFAVYFHTFLRGLPIFLLSAFFFFYFTAKAVEEINIE